MTLSPIPGTETVLSPGWATLADWRAVLAGASVSLAEDSWPVIETSAARVAALLATGRPTYGVNTGFGKLASVGIEPADLALLQRNLILSHAAGTGDALPDPVVRLILAMKAASLARGASGVRPETVRALLAALANDALPVIPGQGSVGASGDLAPLAHMTAALMGFGEIRHRGETAPAADMLRRLQIPPLTLGPKEGLALINGTQVSTAIAVAALV